MREMLEEKLARFQEIERQMLGPGGAWPTPAAWRCLLREHGSLTKVATRYRRFMALNEEIAEVKAMQASHDPEERELAEAELPTDGQTRGALERTAGPDGRRRGRQPHPVRHGNPRRAPAARKRPCSPATCTRCTASTPTRSAGRLEILDVSPTELGGFKEISLAFEGEGVYRELQYESGGHRVQRVPETEAKGRIHTSAATVAVMPEPEDVEIDLKPDDYRIDMFCASGPGGQHVNKTDSAIRLTHHETGHRRPVPGREEPAQEPGQGPARARRRGCTSRNASRRQISGPSSAGR